MFHWIINTYKIYILYSLSKCRSSLLPSKQISHTIDFSPNFSVLMKQPAPYLCNLFIQTYSQIFFLLPIKSAIIPFAIMHSSLHRSFHLLIHRTCLLLSHGTLQSIKPVQTTGWNILTLCIRDNYRRYWESACTLGLHDLFWCVCLLLMFLGAREKKKNHWKSRKYNQNSFLSIQNYKC